MISPYDFYLAKVSEAKALYESKLAMAGITPKSGFSGVLQAEQETQAAVSGQGGYYDAYLDLESLNRGQAEVLPGYNTGVNALGATRAVSMERAKEYGAVTAGIAAKYGMPESLIQAVIQAESSFRAEAVSSAGAQGLMQLMPGTAAGLGVADPLDPAQNIEGGVKYLRAQLDRFGDVRLALAAYNYGPARVDGLGVQNADEMGEYNKLPMHVQHYVEKILHYEKQFAAL